MSSSKSSDPTSLPAGGNSNTEIASDGLPNAGNSKRKTVAIAGTTSVSAATFAALVTYFLSGGIVTETPVPCGRSCVVQEQLLTCESTTGRRLGSRVTARPSTGLLKKSEDDPDPLQKSCDEYNALTRWKSANKIDYTAGMPRDSTAPTAPARGRTADQPLRKRLLDRHGPAEPGGNGDDYSDDSTTSPKRVLRHLRRRDKLHRRASGLFHRK